MDIGSVFIVFSTVSCLSLINSCCRSLLAQTPPAHNHKCNPSQPCQEFYYSCAPNTRPENGMSRLHAGLAVMPALTVQATGNRCWVKYPTVSALSKTHCSLCQCAIAAQKRIIFEKYKTRGILSPSDIMWQHYLCHCRGINLPLNLQNLVLSEYCTKVTHEIIFGEV